MLDLRFCFVGLRELLSVTYQHNGQVQCCVAVRIALTQVVSGSASKPGLATNSIFLPFFLFVKKKSLICLEGKSMTHLREWYCFLPFLLATFSSPSHTFEGLFELTEHPSSAFKYVAWSSTAEKGQGHRPVCQGALHRVTYPPYSIYPGKKIMSRVIQKPKVLNLRCVNIVNIA